jgi:micrococcal nuclease
MRKGNSYKILLVVLILTFISINYSWIDSQVINILDESEEVRVTRVIDGDTIEVEENRTVRMLGFNTPERGEKGYEEARDYLKTVVHNKSVVLEYSKDKTDIYGRELAYVYLNGVNINAKMVSMGYGNLYFPSKKDRFYSEMSDAWEKCLERGEFVCKKSTDECSLCIKVSELDYINEKVVLKNSCSRIECSLDGWYVKDEGRKKYFFEEKVVLKSGGEIVLFSGEGKNKDNLLFWNRKDYVWTDSGDTIFVYDDKGELVVWKSY